MKIGIVGLLIITFFCVSCRIDGSQVNTEEKVEVRTAEEAVRDELEDLFSQLPEQIDIVDLDKILKPKGYRIAKGNSKYAIWIKDHPESKWLWTRVSINFDRVDADSPIVRTDSKHIKVVGTIGL